MIISLSQPNWQKEIYDQLNLFLPADDFSFDPEGKDLIIGENHWMYKNKKREFSSKQGLKRSLYQVFSQETGKRPPWGILTGVRPVKLLYYIEETYGRSQLEKILREDYLLREDKIKDLLVIWEKEEQGKPWDQISYYFHLPFCLSRCSYCSFTSIIGASPEEQANYVRALVKEFQGVLGQGKPAQTRSIYLGGGTPTALSLEALKLLLKEIRKVFPEEVEFTVEAGRVDSFSPDKLALLKDYGVNRLCVNPQSFEEETLEAMNRPLAWEDFQRGMDLVAGYDFPTINLDLIFGLPGEKTSTMIDSLRKALAFDPDNLSIHTLAYKKGSQYKKEEDQGALVVEEAWAQARKLLKGHMEVYYLYRQKNSVANLENIGFSKRGKECLYNMVMMDELESVLSFGLSANSKILAKGQQQYRNPRNRKDYYRQLDDIIEAKKNLLGGAYGQ